MKDKIVDAVTKIYSVGSDAVDHVVKQLSEGASSLSTMFQGLPLFASIAHDASSSDYDEQHYFVIPFKMAEPGFALYTIRNLPKAIPEVNDLPKKRIFHFSDMANEAVLRNFLINEAKAVSSTRHEGDKSGLETLADDLDALNSKLTYGMLFVGGMAAIFNPALGVGIAAKALIPGIGSLLMKYGLRPAGEKVTKYQLEKRVRAAETEIKSSFKAAETICVVNPLLAELELALKTTEAEHDPLVGPSISSGTLPELANSPWRNLTIKAMYDVYKDVYRDPKKHAVAELGPEEIRWFEVLFTEVDLNGA